MTAVSVNHLDLVRFLLARVDDEVDYLRRAQRSLDAAGGSAGSADANASLERRRAGCEVRRSVVGRAQRLLVLRDLPAERPVRELATNLLLTLAEPYRDHPSFRQAWIG